MIPPARFTDARRASVCPKPQRKFVAILGLNAELQPRASLKSPTKSRKYSKNLEHLFDKIKKVKTLNVKCLGKISSFHRYHKSPISGWQLSQLPFEPRRIFVSPSNESQPSKNTRYMIQFYSTVQSAKPPCSRARPWAIVWPGIRVIIIDVTSGRHSQLHPVV